MFVFYECEKISSKKIHFSKKKNFDLNNTEEDKL